VTKLLEAKANLEAEDKLKSGPLHYAARFGRLEVVKVLVEARAQLNPKNVVGDTPLGKGERSGNTDLVAFLEAQGATK